MADNDNNTGKPKGGLSDLVTAESMIQLAIALPVGCLIGGLGGEALDKHFHTGWMALSGVLLGAAAGFLQIYRTASRMLKQGDRPVIPLSNFSDDDARLVVVRAVRLLAVVTLLALPVVWWKMGWQSAVLLAVGAAISGAGLWKWLRLMSVVIARMDTGEGDGKVRPMGSVLAGFLVTMALMLVALYVSLKFLDGSVYALAAGLAMGVFALTFEALRLVKAWTV